MLSRARLERLTRGAAERGVRVMLFHVELVRGGFASRFHRALRDVGLGIRLDLRFALRDLGALESALPRDERREVLLELGAIYAKGALGA